MRTRNLNDALASAEAESPTTGRNVAWESAENVELEVVASNVNVTGTAPRIGLQIQREDNRRRWFDLYFDENNSKSFAATGRKLRALGCDSVLDIAAERWPIDDSTTAAAQDANLKSQLEFVASALKGVKFVGRIDKVSSNKNTDQTPENEKVYFNYFQVDTLIDGPTVASSGFQAPAQNNGPASFGVLG